jgi:hypothetical protein
MIQWLCKGLGIWVSMFSAKPLGIMPRSNEWKEERKVEL